MIYDNFDHDNGGSLACQIGMGACSDSHAKAVLAFALLIFGALWDSVDLPAQTSQSTHCPKRQWRQKVKVR